MKSLSVKFLVVIAVLDIFQLVNAEKRLRFHIKDITAWSDNNYLNFTHSIDESVPTAEFFMKVLKPMNDVDFQVEANAWTKDNKNHYANVNGSYSVCQILALKNASPIAMLLFAHVKTFAAIPDSCPIKKDTYSVKKIWPDDMTAKLKLPEIEVMTNIKVFVTGNIERIKIMDLKVNAEAIYMEVTGDLLRKASGGILSVLNG